MPSDVTVVRAHGAWADGSSWARGDQRACGGRGLRRSRPTALMPLPDLTALDRALEGVAGPAVVVAPDRGATRVP